MNKDKIMLKRMGYDEVAEILEKTTGYIRGLASKGERKMRKTDLDLLRKVY
jgi:hypothetical protein